MGSHWLQTVNKRGNDKRVITHSQLCFHHVITSHFQHGNMAHMIAKKKVYLIKLLRNPGFGNSICIIQSYRQVTE